MSERDFDNVGDEDYDAREQQDVLDYYEELAMTSYVVYSLEHSAWWGPNRCGYTTDLERAGRYTKDEAADIVLHVIPPGSEVGVESSVAENNTAMVLRILQHKGAA